MVGIVIVSHSKCLADGVAELAKMMASDAKIAAAGGLDDGALGTSLDKITKAIEDVYSEDGVVILMDMGSAVMTAEMAVENISKDNIYLLDCPLVEGAVVAAVEAQIGSSVEIIKEKTKETRTINKLLA